MYSQHNIILFINKISLFKLDRFQLVAVNETCEEDPYFYQACSSGLNLGLGTSQDLLLTGTVFLLNDRNFDLLCINCNRAYENSVKVLLIKMPVFLPKPESCAP